LYAIDDPHQFHSAPERRADGRGNEHLIAGNAGSRYQNERRRLLLERTNLAYLKLRQNKKAWRAWRAELREFDVTLSDGI
jgi:hypothetical protein